MVRKGMSSHGYVKTKSSCLSGSLVLKRCHQYYNQVQVAMLEAQVAWCDFCAWSPEFVVVERIKRDDAFLAGVLSNCAGSLLFFATAACFGNRVSLG